jgi:antirestriction protein ArdC
MNREDILKQSEQALQELADALTQGRSDTLVRYLEMLSRFHQYSFGNCMLIALQRPDATHVAGFQRWKQLGRYVKKGEKGILILAPIVRRKKAKDEQVNDADDEANEKPLPAVCGFRGVYVFDVTQTEGAELPEFSRVDGDPGDKLQRLEAVVRSHDIELVYEQHLGGADGRSEGGRIVLRAGLPLAEQFTVLAHELGHELLHRSERRNETTRKIRELEAEAVSFVVSRAIGLEGIGRSADYIQLYNGDKELLLESLDHIQKVASSIIEELSNVCEVGEAAVA